MVRRISRILTWANPGAYLVSVVAREYCDRCSPSAKTETEDPHVLLGVLTKEALRSEYMWILVDLRILEQIPVALGRECMPWL